MIVITGGAGMIGSSIVRALNAAGRRDILVVDDLTDGTKFRNLVASQIADYEDKDRFLARLEGGAPVSAEVVFHQGACSATTEWNGKYMMETNFRYSKVLLHACQAERTPFVYASSAAVYGGSVDFEEGGGHEAPLNVYGWSKMLFDDYVRKNQASLTMAPVTGLRYFNVYGPGEAHKGSMASVAYHLYHQALRGENLKLFGAWDGFDAGQQSRDFVHVDDVAAVNLWCWHAGVSGIFNCGTGHAEPFLRVANAVIEVLGHGEVEYIDFPEDLKGRYQSFTQANIANLRAAGYPSAFQPVSTGVSSYVRWLQTNA